MDGTNDDACSDGLPADHHFISSDHYAGDSVHCSDSGNLQQQQQTMYKQDAAERTLRRRVCGTN